MSNEMIYINKRINASVANNHKIVGTYRIEATTEHKEFFRLQVKIFGVDGQLVGGVVCAPKNRPLRTQPMFDEWLQKPQNRISSTVVDYIVQLERDNVCETRGAKQAVKMVHDVIGNATTLQEFKTILQNILTN